ncbi:C40 family peptidase [Promicromonospora citrea]|uniref:NlpC/P60 domain-containing protein n=3 Tax=Promicromonospora citrea TaxID=43677 RepID=A0A8H9GFC4_9MICO|nr:C40 family peptidase [Promicromonospora citrea]GGM19461.1 hypothetical protein GCM10010102_13750 [Promicromonospora citrea]
MRQVRHGHPDGHGFGVVLALRALAAALLALGLVIPWGPVAKADPPPVRPTGAPSEQDARAARDAVAAGALDVQEAEAALAALRAGLEAAQVAAQVAAADHAEAQQAVEEAERAVAEARRAARAARAGEEEARSGLAEVYRASSRDDGLGPLGVAFEAESVSDLVGRSAAERAVQRRLGGSLTAYQEARAASEAADARWTAAQEHLDEVAAQAEQAYAAAQAAADELAARTRTAEARREALVERLARLRSTSVQIEREREAARAAAEVAAREAAAQERLERQQAVREAATAAPVTDRSGSGSGAEAGSGGAAEPPSGDRPRRPAAPEPPPVVPPPTSGVSSGSAARGVGAVAWARGRLGAPYRLGAAGPTHYDCSGLTMTSWASQGVDITRTSRSQYLAVGKVGYDALRAGDLIFYGTDPADPSSIYHVAMYTGGGMMIEATLPGRPVSENPLRLADAMPFAGRP